MHNNHAQGQGGNRARRFWVADSQQRYGRLAPDRHLSTVCAAPPEIVLFIKDNQAAWLIFLIEKSFQQPGSGIQPHDTSVEDLNGLREVSLNQVPDPLGPKDES